MQCMDNEWLEVVKYMNVKIELLSSGDSIHTQLLQLRDILGIICTPYETETKHN